MSYYFLYLYLLLLVLITIFHIVNVAVADVVVTCWSTNWECKIYTFTNCFLFFGGRGLGEGSEKDILSYRLILDFIGFIMLIKCAGREREDFNEGE